MYPHDAHSGSVQEDALVREILRLAERAKELEAQQLADRAAVLEVEAPVLSELRDARIHIAALEAVSEVSSADRMSLAETLDTLEDQLDALGRSEASLRTQVGALEAELSELRQSIKSLVKRALSIELSDGGVDALEGLISGQGKKLKESEAENAALRADNLSLVNNLEAEGVRIEDLRWRLQDEKGRQREMWEGRTRNLTAELNGWKTYCHDILGKIAELAGAYSRPIIITTTPVEFAALSKQFQSATPPSGSPSASQESGHPSGPDPATPRSER